MELLSHNRHLAHKALTRLNESLAGNSPSELERDGIIQRFEFSFELMWKYAKFYLLEQEGIDLASPKSVIRSCREIGLLNDNETEYLLKVADDRNLTSHTYDEIYAVQLFNKLPEHSQMLRLWYNRMSE